MRKLILCVAALLLGSQLNAQHLIFPPGEDWKTPYEGEELSFHVGVDSIGAKLSAHAGRDIGFTMDSLGNFSWKAPYGLVDRFQKQDDWTIQFRAEWPNGKKISKEVMFMVQHRNRPPVVEDLPIFYVKQAQKNEYQIPLDLVSDPDSDPLVCRSVPSTLPEGAT